MAEAKTLLSRLKAALADSDISLYSVRKQQRYHLDPRRFQEPEELINDFARIDYAVTKWFGPVQLRPTKKPEETQEPAETLYVHNHPNGNPAPPSAIDEKAGIGDIELRLVDNLTELESLPRGDAESQWVVVSAPTQEILNKSQGLGMAPTASANLEDIMGGFIQLAILSVLIQRGAHAEQVRQLWAINRADPTVELDNEGVDLMREVQPDAQVSQYEPFRMKVVKIAWDIVVKAVEGARLCVAAAA